LPTWAANHGGWAAPGGADATATTVAAMAAPIDWTTLRIPPSSTGAEPGVK
jgi:hypothetical protein